VITYYLLNLDCHQAFFEWDVLIHVKTNRSLTFRLETMGKKGIFLHSLFFVGGIGLCFIVGVISLAHDKFEVLWLGWG